MAICVHEGDIMRGEKVSVEAMKIERKGVFARTGTHEGQLAIAERNVMCVIEKEMVLANSSKHRPQQRPRRRSKRPS